MTTHTNSDWASTQKIKRRSVLMGLAATAMVGPLGSLAKGQDGGPLLRVGMQDFYGEQLDPVIGGANSNYIMLHGMYDCAFETDRDTGETIAGIVKSWEIAEDNLSWTFHVRDDVTFHDGSPLTAEDIAFSYNRMVEQDATYAANWRQVLGDTPNIEILDPYTLRIHTNGPQPLLAYSSASPANEPYFSIFPKAYIEKNGIDYFRANPIGSGPYRFVSHTPGDNIEFAAVDYPHWSGVTPKFKRVVMYLVPEESTRRSMIETDQLDVTEASMESAKALQDEGYTIFSGGFSLARFWTFGAYRALAQGQPLADVRVRHALSLAINRQEIIDTLFYGQARFPAPAEGASPDLTPEQREKWAAWGKDAFRFDPDAAKALLAEAGYPDGFTLEFWSVPDSAAPYLKDLALAVAGYWQAIGVQADIRAVDRAAYRKVRDTGSSTDMIGKMAADATLISKLARIDFVVFTSQYGTLDFLADSPDAPEFDAAYLEAKSSMDADRTHQLLERMLEITTASWVCLPVVAAPLLYVHGPRVALEYRDWDQGFAKYFAQWEPVQG
ncbi:MAG TPA: ABC transporter substrate-binding protein [Devosia sp.]|nr:ABC transporter substrate-binding protein [Devosia sp.]